MVEVECPNTVLFLSFPEMSKENFDIDSHSAWVLELEAFRKTS